MNHISLACFARCLSLFPDLRLSLPSSSGLTICVAVRLDLKCFMLSGMIPMQRGDLSAVSAVSFRMCKAPSHKVKLRVTAAERP